MNIIIRLTPPVGVEKNCLNMKTYYPLRILREFFYLFKKKPLKFKYKRLSPNLEEYIYTDGDAFVSMDPHMMALYFYSRGYYVISTPNFLKRIFIRSNPVIVKK